MPRQLLLTTMVASFLFTQPALALLPSDGLDQYGRQSWQSGTGLPQNTVTAIAQTRDGFLWVGTEEGLARFDGYNFVVYTARNTPELKSNSIVNLWADNDGLKIATPAGNLAFKGGRFSETHAQPPVSAISLPFSIRDQAQCSLVDRHGVFWLGTKKGLIRVRNGKTELFSPGDPLANAEILALFEDREGTLWVGTESAGLQMIKDLRFTTYTNQRIRSVFEDRLGSVWIGTDSNGLFDLRNKLRPQLSSANRLSSDVILSLASAANNDLLIGTPDGLNILHGQSVSTLTSADGLPDDFIRSIFVDANGSVWIGTRRGLAHLGQNRVTIYTESNGLGSELVGAITRDKAGELWVATLHGLSRLHNDRFTNYTVANGLSSNIITDLYPAKDGTLWIATQGGGLNRYRGSNFAHIGHAHGLPDALFGVTGDVNGNLWLAAENGIYRLTTNGFDQLARGTNADVAIAAYGTSDGLRVAECSGGGHPAVWKNASGDIWFATTRGAALLPSDHTAMPEIAPTVAIESVSIDDEAASITSTIAIRPGHSRVSFQYAGISLADPQRVSYRYRVKGFDAGWIDAGTRRTAYYTNLGPSHYTFEVQARNSEGLWSPAVGTISFRVLPRFYQTWWFRALLVCLIALAVYAAFLWRVKQVRKEFRAVLNERTRIAREIHDTLAQGFAGVSVQLELVSRLLPSSSERVREPLDQARILARTCLEDARRTIWDLRSQQSESEDLPARLSKLARNASQASGIAVQFQLRGMYRPLETRVEDEMLRIAQEAVANAVRHSGARSIDASLAFAGKTVCLTVSDDGCGMTNVPTGSEPLNGHYGLTGMRERAQTIGAQLSVTSKEGAGTTVTVEAPIR